MCGGTRPAAVLAAGAAGPQPPAPPSHSAPPPAAPAPIEPTAGAAPVVFEEAPPPVAPGFVQHRPAASRHVYAAPESVVYPNEAALFPILLTLSVAFWLLLIVGTFGIALVYVLMGFLFYLFAQSGLIAYIRGNAVRLTPQQYPDLHQAFVDCCQRLGMDDQPEAFLLHGNGVFNAFATRFLGRNFLVLYSDVVDALASRPGAQRFYIGHELGHVHRGHLRWRPLLLPATFLPLVGPGYSRACESTCDNYGALCCDDPEDAVRALAALGAGARRWHDLNLSEYMDQLDATSGFWMSFHELVAEYPWLVKRVARVAAATHGEGVAIPRRNPFAYPFALFVPGGFGAGAGLGGLLVMVAVIGMIAAIAIPSLLRARVSANESAAINDIRTVISAEAAYLPASGTYGTLECLVDATRPGCLTARPEGPMNFLDPSFESPALHGYRRRFVAGPQVGTEASPAGLASYCYEAVPDRPGQTGIRSFAGDHTGRMCFDPEGRSVCAEGELPADCNPLG